VQAFGSHSLFIADLRRSSTDRTWPRRDWPQEYLIGAHNDKMNISDASAELALPNLTKFWLLVGMLI